MNYPKRHASLCRVALALAFTAAAAVPAVVLAQAAAGGGRDYDLPAGSLAATLNAISREAGLALTVNSALVDGQQAAAVRGRMTPTQALRAALAGSGLELVETAAGVYTLRALPAAAPVAVPVSAPAPARAPMRAGNREAMLPEVTVNEPPPEDGSAEQGYVTRKLSAVGPWQGRELQDLPYAMSVIPAELIENVQATTADQIFKMNPTTQLNWPTLQNENPYVMQRGMFVLLVDDFTRVALRAEVPVGVLTSLVDTPFLVFLFWEPLKI
jgi:iron complex outermembrane receptor protein